MTGSPSKPWFAAKRFGFGAGRPIAWQGWAATALLVAVLILATFALRGAERLAVLLAALAVFSGVAWRKTEGGWRWRGGGRR